MTLISRLSDLWRQRPNVVHWTAVGAVALIAMMLVAGAASQARSAAAQWGTSVQVLSAQAPLAVGESVQDQVGLVDVPAHLVPTGALTTLLGLGDLTRPVPQGALLTELDFRPAAGVSPGRRGIGIGVGPHAPDVASGAVVELMLFADIDPFDPTAARPGARRVPAYVLSAERERWLVEIDPADLDAVAQASAAGTIIPVVLSRPTP